jgi:hypothetical protein
MAYISQERKKTLAPNIKAVLKKYGVKGTIGIKHHMCLVVNISSSHFDFIGMQNKKNKEISDRRGMPFYENTSNYIQVNTYHIDSHWDDDAKVFLNELLAAMKGDEWFDESDLMSDYHHVDFYLDINIGKWNKPYVCTQQEAIAA